VYAMLDCRFVSSVLLGLFAGTLGTVAYVVGRRHLVRFRGRPFKLMTLDLALLFGISAVILGLILSVDSLLARVRASYNPQIISPQHACPDGNSAGDRRAACTAGTALAFPRSTVGTLGEDSAMPIVVSSCRRHKSW